MRQRLAALAEQGQLNARERAQAGEVLAALGDLRFDPAHFYLPCRYRGKLEPKLGFVEIPAGPFVMGSRRGESGAFGNEFGNPDSLNIPYTYWIARYPVTVAQYRCFVEAGGYGAPHGWTETGWSWRQGQWDSQVEDEGLRNWLKQRPAEARASPFWWDEQRLHPNRPVVGVCWFEAQAYGAWLDAQLRALADGPIPEGYEVRLSTEAEWEKAARNGDGRRYPWGDEDWDEERANIGDSEIGHPTPVGLYPQGATPRGLHDASGNVWEWTRSHYRGYPYEPQDGSNDKDTNNPFVVRGGSWDFDRRDARGATRGRNRPVDFINDLGFRVVVSLANSEC